jgi:hypothetical protein
VNWCIFFLILSRLLTFPCHAVPLEQNDLTSDFDPIFCDGSLLKFLNFRADCSSEDVCSC